MKKESRHSFEAYALKGQETDKPRINIDCWDKKLSHVLYPFDLTVSALDCCLCARKVTGKQVLVRGDALDVSHSESIQELLRLSVPPRYLFDMCALKQRNDRARKATSVRWGIWKVA
jgi:hypothetical protein